MTITAKYRSTCSACQGAVTPGQRIEWTKGVKSVRHTDCQDTQIHSVPDRPASTRCRYCRAQLSAYQMRRGFRFCSIDCRNDDTLGGQSGYVNGVWHQGSED